MAVILGFICGVVCVFLVERIYKFIIDKEARNKG